MRLDPSAGASAPHLLREVCGLIGECNDRFVVRDVKRRGGHGRDDQWNTQLEGD